MGISLNVNRRKHSRSSHAARRYDARPLDLRKLQTKLASSLNSSYSGTYVRSSDSVPNPALTADGYNSADTFKHDYMLYNLVRKLNLGGGTEAHDRAIAKFIATDKELGKVRNRLNWSYLALNEPATCSILVHAASKIRSLLGSVPDLMQIAECCSFSHGASAQHTRLEGEAQFKYSLEYPEVTANAARLVDSFINLIPLWRANVKGFVLCEYNRVTTVPKDADIDRPIACEPTLNMYVQKGVGSVIRRALKTKSIDLDDQSVNQRLALIGSLTGNLATVDLSAASDSISIEIVKLLLPEAWYDLLLTLRCDHGLLPDGSFITYNKISSMGNGFTFELESLLFWAITQACEDSLSEGNGTHQCSVYGDDIICRSSTVPLLVKTLAVCGFSVNENKSFSAGPFRESCGKHYFRGVDVTPVYVREPIRNCSQLFLLANNLRRWNRRCLGVDDPRYTHVYRWIVAHLPEEWRKPTLPDGQGDGALYGRLDEVLPNFRFDRKRGCRIYKARTLNRVRCKCHKASYKYQILGNIFKGLGGYIATLNSSQSLDHAMGPIYFDAQGRLKTDKSIKPLSFDNLPVPGNYKLEARSLKIYEWLDE